MLHGNKKNVQLNSIRYIDTKEEQLYRNFKESSFIYGSNK